MAIDDPLLPAAVHLTGPHAGEVLRPAVELAGGILGAHRCSRLHYRPGRDLVAQFRADVTWSDGRTRRETLIAATTAAGPPPGTIAVTAEAAGDELTVGVWRWPFDPRLPGLERAIGDTADLLADAGAITGADARSVTTEVVRYRPTDRAVVRVESPEVTAYLKIVRPDACPALVARHRLLADHGLPVPRVIASDPDQGWVLISEVGGSTLRTLVKQDAPRWPAPADVELLITRIAALEAGPHRALRRRLADGPHHAALLSRVLHDERSRLDRIGDALAAARERADQRPDGFVHGDLHENQLVTTDGAITGLLDIDEAGLGDPIDDYVVFAAHLRHRALTAPNAARINELVDAVLRTATAQFGTDDLDAGVAAVLVGLATAPFRAQSEGWRQRVAGVLDLVDHHLGG